MDERSYLEKRQAELEALRQPEERDWQDIAEVLAPEQAQFYGAKTRGDYARIFDSSPLYAMDDFVSGMYSQATNPANQWFMLGHEDKDLAAWKPVKNWLYGCSMALGASLQPARSPFYAEASGWFADVGMFGNGGLFSEEVVGETRFNDLAIPLRELYIDRAIDGSLETVHRKFMMSRAQAAKEFGAVPGLNPDQGGEITVLHCVWPNPDHNPHRPTSKAFLSAYWSPDVKTLWRKGSYFEMPYQVPGWARGTRRVWSVGPGHRVRADMRTLQEMERVHLTAAQYAAEAPLMLHQDSDLTIEDIYPGAVLYGAISESGKELARTLNRGQNLQLSLQQSQQRRDAIRMGFYFSMMQVVNRPQMTATEVLGYKEETLRQMGPNLSRIQHGGLSPFIARRFKMMNRAGLLPPPPPELQGQPLAIEYISPLAVAQKAAEGRAAMQWFTAKAQVAQFKPEIMDNIDPDGLSAVLDAAFGVPPSAIVDPKARDDARAQRQGIQQRQIELQDADAQARIADTASRAASTAMMADRRAA